jgi:hypothetical protein
MRKKLTLNRETLRHLSLPSLRGVAGGDTEPSWSNDVSRCYSGQVTCNCSQDCANTNNSFCDCAM